MKKEASTLVAKKRVLSRVLAEDLAQIGGGAPKSSFWTFTRCPIDVCDFDLD
jgi:hypothetical protein